MARRLLIAAALLAAACSPGGPAAAPSPSPTTAGPVHGRIVDAQLVSTASGPLVFPAGDPRATDPPADTAAADTLIRQVTEWVDRHLTDLQAGGPGKLAEVAAPGLLETADPEVLRALTSLVDPTHPAQQVSYRVIVGHLGGPQWAEVTATVVRADAAVEVEFLFLPTAALPQLVAAATDAVPETTP